MNDGDGVTRHDKEAVDALERSRKGPRIVEVEMNRRPLLVQPLLNALRVKRGAHDLDLARDPTEFRGNRPSHDAG
jgi:hypothetical protein